MFKFNQYTHEELQTCGTDFLQDLSRLGSDFFKLNAPTEMWTEFVLDWFAHSRAPGTEVEARPPRRPSWTSCRGDVKELEPRTTSGEFLVDLSHTTYPTPVDYWDIDYWDTASKTDLKVKLALESEWGDERSHKYGIPKVLEDAAKLCVLRSNVKVMIFASTKNAHKDYVAKLENLRHAHKDTAPWLWIDVPWTYTLGSPTGTAQFGIFLMLLRWAEARPYFTSAEL